MMWDFLEHKAKRLVLATDHSPVLYSYGCDGTTLLSKKHFSFEVGGMKKRKQQGQAVEFLVQKGYLKTVPHISGPVVCCLYKPPVPLTEGKKGWNLFQAYLEFFPHLRSLGHTGLIVSHYVFDRAIASVMGRRIKQHHGIFYLLQQGGPEDPSVPADLLADLDWVL
eukprot:4095319-Lingulodinium_polyedra.AAC.1